MTIKIYCDGGSRGNPGPAASAFIIKDSNDVVLHQAGFYLGIATNNQAEYSAVLKAFEYLATAKIDASEIHFYLDSELVVKQLTGVYKIKNKDIQKRAFDIKRYRTHLRESLFSFAHIPRELNSQADLLVNKTLDSSL